MRHTILIVILIVVQGYIASGEVNPEANSTTAANTIKENSTTAATTITPTLVSGSESTGTNGCSIDEGLAPCPGNPHICIAGWLNFIVPLGRVNYA